MYRRLQKKAAESRHFSEKGRKYIIYMTDKLKRVCLFFLRK